MENSSLELRPSQLTRPSPGSLAGRQPAAEIPGASLKRDYSGVLEYWQMVRRHKAAVILVTLLGTAAAALSTLPEPRIYQARATLEIQDLNADFLNMKNVNPTAEGVGYNPDYEIQTQVKILQSRSMLKRVADKMDANRKPMAFPPPDRLSAWRTALNIAPPTDDDLWALALGTASGSVRVRSSGTNRIVDVMCDSSSPDVAADFLNTLAAEYIDQNLESRWKSTERTGQWLTNQLQDLKQKLEASESQLQAFARTSGLLYTGDDKENVDERKLSDLQKALSDAQSDRVAKQSKFETATASPVGALAQVLDDRALQEAQHALSTLEAQIAQLRVTFKPTHPDVKKLQAQINVVERELEAQHENIVRRIRNDFEEAQRRESLLADAYSSQVGVVSGKAEKAAHYNLLKREVETNRLLYENMLQKVKEASIASALRANNIRVVDAAEPPGAPYKPNFSQRIIMGVLAGLVLGVALAVLRERSDRTIQDPGDAVFYLNVPELGVVPVGELAGVAAQPVLAEGAARQIARAASDRVELISWNKKQSLLAESYRTTLTSILFSNPAGERPKVLVMTSASPKEGKSTTACNLGITLAEINHNVLLIDADMRRPRLHTVFGMKNTGGLTDLLHSKTPLTEEAFDALVHETEIPGLSVLLSGADRKSASSLVHSPRMQEVFELARRKFDTVLVDTPPMGNISDARVMARLSDAVILVLRSGSTTRDAALMATRRFAEDGIQILGVILNSWNPKTPGYSYYGHYYAGYHHYYPGGGDGPSSGRGSGGVSTLGLAKGGETADGAEVEAAPAAGEARRTWMPRLRRSNVRRSRANSA